MTAVSRSDFPSSFVWGTATASYQIEGAVNEDGRGPSIWDDLARVPGAIVDGSNGDVADDHYHRFRDDVAMMADLGVSAYRFSVAWPRIQADGTGPANAKGLAFYHDLVEELLAKGITPYATLYHWDLPSALEAQGGWLVRDTAQRFADYSSLVVEGLGDVVSNWITLNEPWCSAFLGYASGEHAPGKKLGTRSAHAVHHLMLGHGLAVDAIRSAQPTATVGVTLNLSSVRPASDSDADKDAHRRLDGLGNRIFLDPLFGRGYPADVVADLGEQEFFDAIPAADLAQIAVPIDFLGVNYYTQSAVTVGEGRGNLAAPGSEFVTSIDTGEPRTEMGWPVIPAGLLDVLEIAHSYDAELPLFVTENGAAYDDKADAEGYVDDEDRREYLERHFEVAAEAIGKGIPLAGYFVWSLIDNFEWAWGYTKRFGIVRVDYETQKRTPKKSALWFSEFIK